MRKPSRLVVLASVGVLAFILAGCARREPTRRPAGHIAVPLPAPFEIRLPSRNFTPPEARVDWTSLFAKPEAQRVHAIVQFSEIPDDKTHTELEEAGIVLGQPLTGRAYMATVKRDIQTSLPVLKKIRWVGSLLADDKIAPELKQAGGATWARRFTGRIELIIKLFPDANIDAAIQKAKDLGGNLLGEARAASIFTISLLTGRERDLVGLDDVRYIEPMTPPSQGESDRARAHVHADVGAIPAGHPNGNGITVGVFDDGHASTTHPDFGNRSAQGDTGTFSPGQHPTMTAGMIAGDGSQSLSHGASTANQWRGLAPAAQIRSYSFTNSGTDHVTDYLNDVTDAIQNDNVNVLNNSWGDWQCTSFAYGSYAGRAPFLDGVVTGSLGRSVTIVFSAGNDRDGFGSNNDTSCIPNKTAPFANYTTINHPKAAKNAIVVGAIDSNNNAMTEYSSWGPTLDGRIKPDIVASGQHNGTMMASGVSQLNNPYGQPYGSQNQQAYRTPNYPTNQYMYAWFDETSCAAAIVSGGIALMLDDWRQTFPGRADPLPSTIRALLVHNALDLDDATTWYNPGPDYSSGYGLVQINETLTSLERGDALEGSVAHQGEAHYFLDIPAGTAQVRVTLAWDDPPAIENANPALINDLDLVITDPSGMRRFPWTLDPANSTTDAIRIQEDHVNNLEQVVVDAPAVGTWSVIVRGTNIPQGRQSFSIITANNLSRQPVDLILALDTSSSMNSLASSDPGALPKVELLRRSVTTFLETWKMHSVSSDRVGLVAFSSNVATTPTTIPALQPFLANFSTVSSAVGTLTASGCTALGGALQVGFASFDPASSNKRTILLLSDGMQTANPFVGEKGTPSRLQIASYLQNDILPFGAWFCTPTPATGPGGGAIVPDGIPIVDHGAEIYTIGVGVNGADFHDLIERLAAENHGSSHFTTAPDTDLDLLFINDLVRALKSNTLEMIMTDAGTLNAGSPRNIYFPVNATCRSITVVVSWQGSTAVGAVDTRITGPSGAALIPSHIQQQGFFTILKFDIPGTHGAVPGTWRLKLTRTSAPAVTHQVSIIADDSCFHYDVGLGPGLLRAGDPLNFTARISSSGQPRQLELTVRARVLTPTIALGNLLSEWVPKTKSAQKYLAGTKAERLAKAPAFASALEAALIELSHNPAFLKILRHREPLEVTLKRTSAKEAESHMAAGLVFAASLDNVIRPGIYDIIWEIEGKTACGPVRRQELATVFVRAAKSGRSWAPVTFIPGLRGTFTLSVKPTDPNGNLLGPGMGSVLSITVRGFDPVEELLDRFDGSYIRTFAGSPKGPVEAQVSVGGETWTVSIPLERK